MVYHSLNWAIFLAVLTLAACAGLPVRGSVEGASSRDAVDSEVARYYLANYLADKRHDVLLDQRIDQVYRTPTARLQSRRSQETKR
jgi:hypothetical protein